MNTVYNDWDVNWFLGQTVEKIDMIRVAFCDDDISVLNQMSMLVERYRVQRNKEIAYAAFCSPLDLLAEIEKGAQLDIIFLDVLMPGENGIDAAKEIRKYDNNVKIIFLTSSAEFAVESYMVGAYFYQLKPIWEESFYRLMDSVISECKKEWDYSLVLRCKTGIARIELDKLEYCEIIGHTLFFYMENGNVLESAGRLDELHNQLKQYPNFLRVHRSFLINMDYVQGISAKAVSMMNLAEIPIPRGKYAEIKKVYLEYAFTRKQVFYHE